MVTPPGSPLPPLPILQRDWYWRGWQIRYRYGRPHPAPANPNPPLVCLHGFGASSGHWRHNLGVWGQRGPVYALDLLGFGASAKPATGYSPLFWATLVRDFCREVVGEPGVWVGNSLGSVVAMTGAIAHGDWVRGVVWVNLPDNSVLWPKGWPPGNAAPKPRNPRRFSPFAAFAQGVQALVTGPWVITPILYAARSPRILYPALASAYGDTTAVDDTLRQMVRDPAHDRHAAQALRFITRGMGQIPRPYQARIALPQLQIPMLLLWGSGDRLVPPQLAPRCVALNPQIQLEMFPGGGHCLQDECPDRVNALVLDWLAQHF